VAELLYDSIGILPTNSVALKVFLLPRARFELAVPQNLKKYLLTDILPADPSDLLSTVSIRKKLHPPGKYSVLTTLRRQVTLSPVEKELHNRPVRTLNSAAIAENMADNLQVS
jgi:hypothetical protein